MNKQKYNISTLLDIVSISPDELDKLIAGFNASMCYENAILQLQGIAYAITFDDLISSNELKTLAVWMKHNISFVDHWPIKPIYALLMSAVEQGSVTDEINARLLDLLSRIGKASNPVNTVFDQIDKKLRFKNKKVVFTGVFASEHSRTDLHILAKTANMIPKRGMSATVDILFVGEKGSRSWRFGKFGRKIEAAIVTRETTGKPLIISENDFFNTLIKSKLI